jgi:hypothetical protein
MAHIPCCCDYCIALHVVDDGGKFSTTNKMTFILENAIGAVLNLGMINLLEELRSDYVNCVDKSWLGEEVTALAADVLNENL